MFKNKEGHRRLIGWFVGWLVGLKQGNGMNRSGF